MLHKIWKVLWSKQRPGTFANQELRVCFHMVSTSYSQTCSNQWHTAERKTTHCHRDGQWRFSASHGWFSSGFVMRHVLGQWKSLHLTRHWLWKGILKLWKEFQADSNNSISPQCRWDWQTPVISYWEQGNENLCCFTSIVSVSTRYGANRKSWIKEATFIDYLKASDAKLSSHKRKMLLFTCLCAAYPQDKLLTDIKIVFFPKSVSALSTHLTKE